MIRLCPIRLATAAVALATTVAFVSATHAAPTKSTAEESAPTKAGSKKSGSSGAAAEKNKTAAESGGGKSTGKKDAAKKDGSKKDVKTKSNQIANFGDWGVYVSQGKAKTCYALAKPSARAPAQLKRDDGYIFISNRPADNVRNEISIIMGFAMKDGSEPKAEIGGASFDLFPKGANAWVKNAAEESQFIEALRRGSKLVVKATSVKGNVSTDTYSLSGLSDALQRVQKECP